MSQDTLIISTSILLSLVVYWWRERRVARRQAVTWELEVLEHTLDRVTMRTKSLERELAKRRVPLNGDIYSTLEFVRQGCNALEARIREIHKALVELRSLPEAEFLIEAQLDVTVDPISSISVSSEYYGKLPAPAEFEPVMYSKLDGLESRL